MKQEPRGIRNNNPLNIRVGNNWQGEKPRNTDGAFEQFESMQYGLRAGFKILKRYITGADGRYKPCNTIRKIVSRWAPPSENATNSYIDFVSRKTGIHPDQIVWFNRRADMVAIVHAMCMVETGRDIDTALIESAYDLV